MDSEKTIIFKVSVFPQTSETFVIHQIITAIELGYNVKILLNQKLDFNKSLHKELLFKYNLEDKIIYDKIIIPKNKILRLITILSLFIKYIHRFFDIYNFYKYQSAKKKSISWIYYWVFYNNLDSTETIFHVQFGNNKFPLDILKAKCSFKSKLIVSFHGHDAFFPMYGYMLNNNYYELLFKGANLIIANTEYLANQIKELGCPSNKLEIVPVAVDTVFFNPKHKAKSSNTILNLVNVGRLDPIKGHKYSIEIVKKLIEKKIDVKLQIIGEGEERANLMALILKNNLEDNVQLLGKKSQLDIKNILLNSDLYIFTAVPVEQQRRETQGLATLEAQACGLPVIAYDSGGIKYTIDNTKTGFIFDEFEIDKVIEKLLFLYENREVIQEMSNNSYDFIENKFSQKKINKKWEKIYCQVLEKNNDIFIKS